MNDNKVGRPLKYKNVEDLDNKIREYFERCEIKDKPFTMSGLALWLDMDRRSLVNYAKRDEYFPSIKRARTIVEASMEERMLMGEFNVTGAIFSLKNNCNWKDKIETENTNTNTNKNYDVSNLTDEQLDKILKGE